MTIERRLKKLEEATLPKEYKWHQFVVDEHEIEDEVIRRHFGDEGPPGNAAFIFIHLV